MEYADEIKGIGMEREVRGTACGRERCGVISVDNAGKIHLASRSGRWSNIFRVSMTLDESVDRELLEAALSRVYLRFPSLAVRVRRGVLWYWLESLKRPPKIIDEGEFPLAYMPLSELFESTLRVICSDSSISCEFFHSVTDGNGAMVFLKNLVAEYLSLRHGVKISASEGVVSLNEPPAEREYADLFFEYGSGRAASVACHDSYRIKGTPEARGRCHVSTMEWNSEELCAMARGLGVSVTSLLASAVLLSGIELQSAEKVNKRCHKHVNVLIPCDLRRVFGRETLRNFALYVTPGVDPRLGEYSLAEIAGIVQRRLSLEVTEKNMRSRIEANVRYERNPMLRMMPLFLKNIILKLGFAAIGERKSLLSLSNLGVVRLPNEMSRYVRSVDFVLGTQKSAPYNIGVATFGGRVRMNVIRNIKEAKLEGVLMRVFNEAGIAPLCGNIGK